MNVIKKLTALLIAVMMLTTSIPTVFAGEYTVEDAYEECAQLYPEFLEKVKAQGVSDRQIISFLKYLQNFLLNKDEVITEYNFEDAIVEAVLSAFSQVTHSKVRDALTAAFPEAVVDGMDGIIHPDFQPIAETVKNIVFENNMLGTDDDKPTETEPATESTEASTENTEASSEPATEGATTDATEESTTEAPTEATTSGNTGNMGNMGNMGNTGNTGNVGNNGDDESATSAPTENPTQAPTEKPTTPKKTFSDMDQAPWAKEAVESLTASEIISGYPDGTFKPNNPITRAEFAKIIVGASGRYDKNATASFTDVDKSAWYYSYVASAYNLGFIKGRSDTIFDPVSQITRADHCTIAYRLIKSINSEFKAKCEVVFADADSIPSYAKEAVNALASAGIIGGVGGNRFDPMAPATRAQSAKIIYGSLQAAFGF